MESGSISDNQVLDRSILMLEELRKLDDDMPIQYALSFLYISRYEGLSSRELADHMGVSQAAASRQVAALADHRRKGEGYKIVSDERDPQELRRKILKLTSKGRRVVKSLVAIWKL